MDEQRRRLAWVHKNRARRDRSAPVGRVVGAYAAELMKGSIEPPAWIRDAICDVADHEFEQWCKLRSVDRGVVVIGVAEASLVEWLTRAWRNRLLDVLRKGANGARVRDVRFEFHREGPMSMDG